MAKEIIDLIVDGGKATSGPAMGQKLGPLGINIQDILSSINKKTTEFVGMKVPVKVIIETKDKSFDIEIGVPPVSELIKKEAGLEKGSGLQKIKKSANLGMEQIIKVAKMKYDSMLVRDLKSAVKNVIGSCGTLGVLVEGKAAKDASKDVDKGNYDDLIKKEVTTISQEKKQKLNDDLTRINAELEKELAKQKAAEAAAAPEVTAAATTETAATPEATPAVAGAKGAPAATGAKAATPAVDAKKDNKKPAKKK
ncbi:50S ribosomal protein L11 [Candidatus Woesearchaeota archaeon]|nr:50S ribosomal protein L11 [Candidatus Woesearchaeota archaeon]